tara:strand:+ start:466 stop:2421 length:1956 start_codon:yes stop_codon:yes gene_type:complete
MQGAGINPARIQSVLRQATDDQLMLMLKRPDRIPSMFVQQEIARRRNMRMAASAELSKQQPMQQPMQQPIGMSNGGRFVGVDDDPQTGMPYAGAMARGQNKRYLRDPNPEYRIGKNYAMAYNPSSLGSPNLPPAPSFGTMPIAQTMNLRNRGLAASSLTDAGMEEGQGGFTIGRNTTVPNLDTAVYSGSQPNTGVTKSGIESLQTDENNVNATIDLETLAKTISGMDVKNPDLKAPDYKNITDAFDDINKRIKANNTDIRGEIDKESKRVEGIMTQTANTFDEFKTKLENFSSEKAALFDSAELEKLQKTSRDNYESAINFVENDKSIAEAQKKLIDAMKPQTSNAQRFFGYLASLGGKIAGSDSETFLEALGKGTEEVVQEYKFDNEKERQRFINNAKMMVDLEKLKFDNKMKVYEMKGNLYNMDKDIFRQMHDYKLAKINARMEGDTGIFELGTKKVEALNNFSKMISDNTIKKLELDNNELQTMFTIVDGKSKIEQQKFADQLNIASDERDRMRIMYSTLTDDMKNFSFLDQLPEDKRAQFLPMITSASSKGIGPDKIAEGLVDSYMKSIDNKMKESTNLEQDVASVAKEILGNDLYNSVKNSDGSINRSKLFQFMFSDVYKVQSGLPVGGSGAQNVVDYSTFLQGTN